jgi:hypothetical protein
MRITSVLLPFAATLAAGAIVACSAPSDAIADGESLGQDRQPFSTTPSEPNHESVTAAGLSFLRPEIVTALQIANVATDAEFVLVSANHFDDCNFSGGSQVVVDAEAEAVAALDPAAASPESDAEAIRKLGRALHAVQDFYAHSNWVELGAEGLVDSTLGPWPILSGYAVISPAGIAVVEGTPPRKAKVWRDARAPYPANAVVHVKTKGKETLGLISGTVDYEAGDSCPASVAMTHEELNKDKSTLPGREAQHARAMTLATDQTRHEWCRMRALTRAAWGDAGEQRLLTWVGDASVAPACTP